MAIKRTRLPGRPHELVFPTGVVLNVFGVFAVDGAHLAQRTVLRHAQGVTKTQSTNDEGAYIRGQAKKPEKISKERSVWVWDRE